MDLVCEERLSDSPYVERIWRSQTDRGGAFTSIAEDHWEIVVSKFRDKTTITVRGPETRATPAFGPADAEFFGIQFRTGAFMPHFPAKVVMDRQDMNLPEASCHSFWLNCSTWQFPDFENADTFVDRLVRECLLVRDPIVETVLKGRPVDMSVRSVQRRFLQTTGLTYTTIHQIKRARYATILLKEGVSILDTVAQVGYFDQPHLTRALKHYIGKTPAQIMCKDRVEPLSFLYKTQPF